MYVRGCDDVYIVYRSSGAYYISFSCSLMQYALNEPDPLVQGIQKRDNPFIKKGGCTIL